MTKFEDRLFDDLFAEHGANLTAKERQEPPPRRRGHRPLWITAAAVVLAAGTAAGLTLAGGSATAYGVTQNSNGTVTLAFKDIPSIDQTNDSLAKLGAPVRLVRMSAICHSTTLIVGTNPSKSIGNLVEPYRIGSDQFTIKSAEIPAGDTLVVGVHPVRGAPLLTVPSVPTKDWVWLLVRGAAPTCLSTSGAPVGVGFGDLHHLAAPQPPNPPATGGGTDPISVDPARGDGH